MTSSISLFAHLSRRGVAAVAAVGLLALTACGGDSGGDAADDTLATTPDAEPVETEPAVTEPVVTEPAAAEPAATEPAATEPAATEPAATEPAVTEPVTDSDAADDEPEAGAGEAESADCLIGDWVITQDEMNAYYDALEASLSLAGPAPVFEITGQTLLTMTPTEYVYTGDFDLTLDIAGQNGTGTSAGTVTGTWSETDGIITTELGESNLSVSVTVGGLTLDGSELANGLLNGLPINAAPYDCAGPTIDFQVGEGAPRHPVKLTPA